MNKFFFILVLGSLILAASADSDEKNSENSGVFDKVKEYADKVIKTLKSPFTRAYEKSKDILKNSYIKGNQLYAKFQNFLSLSTSELVKKINNVEAKDKNSKFCKEKAELQVEILTNITLDGFEKCSQKFTNEISEQNKTLHGYNQNLDDKVEELRLALVTCIHFNPVTTTKCAYGKLDEYKNIIKNYVVTTEELLSSLSKTVLQIPQEFLKCNEQQAQESADEIDRYNRELDFCLENPDKP